MRTTIVNISFAAVTFVAMNVAAQPAPVAPPTKSVATNPTEKSMPAPIPVTTSTPIPTKAARASVSRIVEALAADIGHIPGRAFVVTSSLVSDTSAPRGTELAQLVATQLAGRRAAGARAFAKPATLTEARSEARSADVLVMLDVKINGGKLRVTADVFPVPRTVWARVRDPEPGPIAHAFQEAAIDAEIRTYLAPISMAQLNVVRGQNFENDVLALGCTDLDADGATEIITVSRRRVTTVRLRDGKVVALRSRNWSDLSPLAPVPLREPIGLAAFVARPSPEGDKTIFLDVGLSDRSKSVRLDGQLGVVTTLAGLPVGAGGGAGDTSVCVHIAQPWLAGPLVPCTPEDAGVGAKDAEGDPQPQMFKPKMRLPLTGSFDAMASASLISSRGEGFVVMAARNERGVVEVRDDAGHAATIDGAGAQLAVGDLDQDGEPEILSSLDVPLGMMDAVVVRSWTNRTAAELSGVATRPKEILRLPAAAGVRAIAVCPPDDSGRAPFVVATADELWVAR